MRQFRPLRLALVLIAAGEVFSLVWLGQTLGLFGTFAVLLLSAMAGIALIRRSGVGLVKLMQAGRPPADQLSAAAAGSLLSGLAGLFLIVPGLVSDVIALLLLLPFTRTGFAKLFQFDAVVTRSGQFGHPPGDVVDVEAVEIIEPDRRLD